MNQNTKSTTATTTSVSRPTGHYERQINEPVHVDNPTQECVFSEPTASGLQNSRQRSSTMLNLVTQEQSKWRKQVRSNDDDRTTDVFFHSSRFNNNGNRSTIVMNF
jgi:hypothetical protein